jgi:hypothetical protein
MKKLLPLLLLGFLFLIPRADAATYSFARAITVTSTASVASGTNINFPMLVSSTLVSWQSSSTGGDIQNIVTAPNGGLEPADLVFATSSANCNLTSLNFETERYTSSTGELIDWVQVPSLSTATVIYACYGNPSVNTDKSHPSSTWDANYKGVYHFPNGTVLTAGDSTSNKNNGGLQNSPTSTTGEIDGAASFNGSTQYASTTNLVNMTQTTISTWINVTTLPTSTNKGFIVGMMDGFRSAIYDKDLGISAAGAPEFYTYDGNPKEVTSTATIAAGGWHYITGVANGTNDIIYVDGVAKGTLLAGASFNSFTVPNFYMSGQVATSATPTYLFMAQSLDETRFSNNARSPSWILTEYNNQNSPSTFYAIGNEIDFTAPDVTSTILNVQGALNIKGALTIN